jgi:E3 ubiquitin-protein ligase DOA10
MRLCSKLTTAAECRICLSPGSTEQELIQPCACAGTMGYTHAACLITWVQEKGSLTCELCKQQYQEQYV